jgi:hypothetical protein
MLSQQSARVFGGLLFRSPACTLIGCEIDPSHHGKCDGKAAEAAEPLVSTCQVRTQAPQGQTVIGNCSSGPGLLLNALQLVDRQP